MRRRIRRISKAIRGRPQQRSFLVRSVNERSHHGIPPQTTTDIADVQECTCDAPVGTFPVFKEDGSMPGALSSFNPSTTDYSSPIGPYSVKIQTEIPLKYFSPSHFRALSKSLIPTHCFQKTSAYLVLEKDPQSGKYPLYVLPAAYYREVLPMKKVTKQCPRVAKFIGEH